MTVKQLKIYKNDIVTLRNDLNNYVSLHPEIVDDFENIYLRTIGVFVDFEQVINNAINRAEVDF